MRSLPLLILLIGWLVGVFVSSFAIFSLFGTTAQVLWIIPTTVLTYVFGLWWARRWFGA